MGPSHPASPGDRVGASRWRSDGMRRLVLPAPVPRRVTAVAAVRSSVVATRPSYGCGRRSPATHRSQHEQQGPIRVRR